MRNEKVKNKREAKTMVKKLVKVEISPGIHFRPAGKVTEYAMKYKSAIIAKTENSEANVKSFLNLLAAGIKEGDEIELICEGEDENEALEAMVELFSRKSI